MSNITLTWDQEGVADSFSIYRATQPFEASSLPEALVTGLTVKSYVDSVSSSVAMYYYRIASIRGGAKKVSDLISISPTSSFETEANVLTFFNSRNSKYSTLSNAYTISNLKETYGTTYKWFGSVIDKNGIIYGVPGNATTVLKIDTKTDTVTETNYGLNLSGSDKWFGGCMDENGIIYCAPDAATGFLIIDTVAQTAKRDTLGLTLTSTEGKYRGAAYCATNKCVFFLPSTSNSVLMYNTVSKVVSTIATGFSTTEEKWRGTAFHNDNIYLIPQGATSKIVKINCIDFTVTQISSDSFSQARSVVAYDGNVYFTCVISSTVYMYRINTSTNEVTRLLTIGSSTYYVSANLTCGADGHIYSTPDTGYTYQYSIVSNTITVLSASTISYGGPFRSILAPNGSIYSIPSQDTLIKKLCCASDLQDVPVSIVTNPMINR